MTAFPQLFLLRVFPILLFLAAAAHAQISWTGNTSGNWNTTSNWNLNRVPNTTEKVTFPSTGNNKTTTYNRPSGTVFDLLTFQVGGYTVNGTNTLTLQASGLSFNRIIESIHGTGTTNINVPIQLQANSTFRTTASGGDLRFNHNNDISLGANTLTITTAADSSIRLDSRLTGTGGVIKSGAGTLRIDRDHINTGTYQINAGRLSLVTTTLTGAISTAAGTIFAPLGSTTKSNATIGGDFNVSPGGFRFNVDGNLVFSGSGTRFFSTTVNQNLLDTLSPVRVSGSVTTGGHRVRLTPSGGFAPGTEFVLIDKISGGAINNTTRFLTDTGATINENTEANYGSLRFRFSYIGGSHNDFSATVVPAPVVNTTNDWNGSVNANWATPGNWSTGDTPLAGHIPRFGVASSPQTVTNNFGGNYGGIHFAGIGGFLIQDDPNSTTPSLLTLSGNNANAGIRATHGGAVNEIRSPVMLLGNQTWSLTGSGGFRLGAASSLDLGTSILTLSSTPFSGSPVYEINAPISGTGGLVKDGPGIVDIVGSVANTFTGNTTVTRGTLRLSKTTGVAIPGNIVIGGGANAANLQTTVAEKIATTSVVTIATNGTLLHGAQETIGGLVFEGGTVSSASNLLIVNGNLSATANVTMGSPLRVQGSVRDWTVSAGVTWTQFDPWSVSPANTGVTVAKKGAGNLRILDTSPDTTVRVDAGTLEIMNFPNTGPRVALNGGALIGRGQVRAITTNAAGGVIRPSNPSNDPGFAILNCFAVTLNSNATLVTRIDEEFEFGQLRPSGAISLGGATLDIQDNAALPIGAEFRIIQNNGTNPVSGTFAGLPEGALVNGAFNRFSITYSATSANHVELTVVAVDSGVTRVWTGGGANRLWSTPANWSGGIVPGPGDTLEFPVTAITFADGPVNDLPAGMIFQRIRFTGTRNLNGNLEILGNSVGLIGGVENTSVESVAHAGSRRLVIDLPVSFLANAEVANLSNQNPRALDFRRAVTAGGLLRFTGRNGAVPQGSVLFTTANGSISGPGGLRVESNANVLLNPSVNDSYTGNTAVVHGSLNSLTHALLAQGLNLGDGSQSVSAQIKAAAAPLATTIEVPDQATLTGGPLQIESLIVQNGGTATLNGGPASGDVLQATTLTIENGGTLTAPLRNLAVSGATLVFGSLETVGLATGSLTLVSGTVLASAAVAVDDDLEIAIDSALTAAALSVEALTLDGGAIAVSGTATLGGNLTVKVGAPTLPGGVIFTGANGDERVVQVDAGAILSASSLTGVSASDPVVLVKTGGGMAAVDASLAFVNALRVEGGVFRTDAADGGGIALTTVEAATLTGAGTLGPVLLKAAPNTVLLPGGLPLGGMTVATLETETFAPTALPTLRIDILGPAVPGVFHHSLATTSSPIFAAGTRLQLSLGGGFVPLAETIYTLIACGGSDPIVGLLTAAGDIINEGDTLELGSGVIATISYQGGDGNDLTATITTSPAGIDRVWSGLGGDNQWSTAENWSGDVAPQATERLRFPAGAAQTTNHNDLPADQSFGEIRIEAAYTFTGNRVLADGGIVSDFPSGTATVGFPLLFEADSNALIESNSGGKLLIDGAVTLGQDAALVLRRVDPTFIFGTTPIEIGSILAKLSTAGHSVATEGGGRVRFLDASRTYQGTTFVRHGRLQTLTSGNLLPGNLTVGGGIGPAIYENPGTTISVIRTLRLEPGGTHTFTGAGASDNVSEIDFAGGDTDGSGTFNIRDRRTTRSGFAYVGSGTTSFLTSSGLATKIIDVEEGASHTIATGGTITGSNSSTFNSRKEGGGSLRVAGNFFGNQITLTEGSLGPLAGGTVHPKIVLGGGILRGLGTVNGEITANSTGGVVSPGGFTVADNLGILTIASNYLPNEATTLRIEIGGTTPGSGHDQLRQSDNIFSDRAIDLADSVLDVRLVNGFVPTPDDTFRIIDKLSATPIVRTFAGKGEGSSFVSDGYQWSITYTGGDGGNDVVLTAIGPAVAIAVEQPAANPITNGGAVGFGSVPVDEEADLVFTVRNTGTPGSLELNGSPAVALTGPDAAEFEVTVQPDTSIAPGGSTTFTVRFAPLSDGAKSATLTIDNTDPDERPFVIQLTGTGQGATPPAPPELADITIIPATPTTPGKFSAVISGPPNAFMELEVSEDLGINDPWGVIHTFQLDATGQAVLTDIEFLGTTPATSAFFRTRQL